MVHEVCRSRLEGYAEGELHWPFTWLVEMHTARCPECRHELRMQLAFLRQVDKVLFSAEEVVQTATRTVHRRLVHESLPKSGRFLPIKGFSPMLAGAAVLLIIVALLPVGLRGVFSPSTTVMAASSWSEGVATVVAVGDAQNNDNGLLMQLSNTSSGVGTAVPIRAPEERGG